MAATVRIEFNAREAERALAQLGVKVSRVIPRALNRAGTSARAAIVPIIAKDMGLKSGAVRERIVINEASSTRQVVTLRATAKRVPLIELGASGPEPSYGRGRGVTARTKGGRQRYPHAFIATMPSGHRGVFQRVRASRSRRGLPYGSPGLPITQLFGPSIYHVFQQHIAVAEARGREALLMNLQHEIKFALSER